MHYVLQNAKYEWDLYLFIVLHLVVVSQVQCTMVTWEPFLSGENRQESHNV